MSHLRAVARLLRFTDRIHPRIRPVALGALSPVLLVLNGPAGWVTVGIVLLLAWRSIGWTALLFAVGTVLIASLAGALGGAAYAALTPAGRPVARSRHLLRSIFAALVFFSTFGASFLAATSQWTAGWFPLGSVAASVAAAALIYGIGIGWITWEPGDSFGTVAASR